MRASGRVLLGVAALLVACARQEPPPGFKDAQPAEPPKPAIDPSAATSDNYYRPSQLDPLTRIMVATPRDAYEESVKKMTGTSLRPDALQMVCSQWFPAHGHDVADSFMAWRKKNDAALTDIDKHAAAIWQSNAGTDTAYVKRVKPQIRKNLYDEMMRTFDALPTAEFEKVCIDYGPLLRLPEWDLEKRWKRDLRAMRAHALAAAQ